MSDEISELKEDLLKKFDRLCLIQAQPALFVTERFDEIRYEIDFDAERIIESSRENQESDQKSSDSDSSDDDNDDSIAQKEDLQDFINGLREGYIHVLKTREESILEYLSNSYATEQRGFSALKQKVDDFISRSSAGSKLDELEDEYIRLALDIVNETRLLERAAFHSQTIFYLKSTMPNTFGKLVHLADEYFNSEEIEMLK